MGISQTSRRVQRTGRATPCVVETFERRVLMSGTPVPVGDASEFRVNVETAADQGTYGDRTLATDASGNFVVAWKSNTTGAAGVYARRYDESGRPLGGEMRVGTGTGMYPSVAMNAGGRFVVLAQSLVRNKTVQVARLYDEAGGFVREVSCGALGSPKVGMAGDGSFVVAGQRAEGLYFNVFAQRFTSTGEKLGAEFRVNDFTSGDQSVPSVAVDGQGNFLVAWQSRDQDGSEWGVYAKRYDALGRAESGEFRVNAGVDGSQLGPSAVLLPGGGFAVAWTDRPVGAVYSSSGDIRLRRSDGATFQDERTVNSYTDGQQISPSLAVDASGNATVVWHSQNLDGSGAGVYGQQYDPAGQPAGWEFRLNSHTDNEQAWASVAAQPNGRFVAAWTSTGQDNTDGSQGVYARLFQPPASLTAPSFSATAITDASAEEEQVGTSSVVDLIAT